MVVLPRYASSYNQDATASPIKSYQNAPANRSAPRGGQGQENSRSELFGFLFGKNDHHQGQRSADTSGAKKVDPKIFFSKERTFMSWMHTSLWLAGASLAMTAYSDNGTVSAIYGLMLLPIAIAFIVYAMIQCKEILCSYVMSQRGNFLILFSLIDRLKKESHACNEIARTV
jgi:hypothetical protein